jgi:hypothetical protein
MSPQSEKFRAYHEEMEAIATALQSKQSHIISFSSPRDARRARFEMYAFIQGFRDYASGDDHRFDLPDSVKRPSAPILKPAQIRFEALIISQDGPSLIIRSRLNEPFYQSLRRALEIAESAAFAEPITDKYAPRRDKADEKIEAILRGDASAGASNKQFPAPGPIRSPNPYDEEPEGGA